MPINPFMTNLSSAFSAHPPTPRKSSPLEELDDDDFATANDDNNGDTVEFSNKSASKISKKIDKLQEAQDNADELQELKEQQQLLQQLDKEEIHAAKVKASFWGSIPYIGPFIGIFSNVFVSPESNVANRTDVRLNGRDEDDALKQEKRIKAAKIKAALVTAVPQVIGFTLTTIGGFMTKHAEENKKSTSLAKALMLAGTIIGTTCGLTTLGYWLGEKPASKDFNKTL